MNYDLRSYVKIYNGFLSESFSNTIVSKLKSVGWELHTYNVKGRSYSFDNDLSISYPDLPEQMILKLQISDLLKRYIFEDMKDLTWWKTWDGYSEVRFNKYETGTEMKTHCDHIKTLFDGGDKGVPILTVLGGLNDDYEGGELIMWDDYVVPLKAGTVMVFPSNFMYPHKVNVVTKGVRYSYVSWVW